MKATQMKTKPRNKSVRRMLAAILLAFESFIVFFATLAAFGLRVADPAVVWTVGLLLAFVMIATPAILGSKWSYWFGTALQLLLVLTGIWLPAMWFIGGLFACLWAWAMIAGSTIDKAKAAFEAATMGQTETVAVFEVKQEGIE